MDEGPWMKFLDTNLSNPSNNDKSEHQGINRVLIF